MDTGLLVALLVLVAIAVWAGTVGRRRRGGSGEGAAGGCGSASSCGGGCGGGD